MTKQLTRLSLGIIIFIVISCTHSPNKQQGDPALTISDTTQDHGYNELANKDERERFAISDYNTDNADIQNIDRPKISVIETPLDTALLYAIWTSDPDGPHADFVFSKESFFVMDYDGDGDMPYLLTDKKLKIYYSDFIQEGEIVFLDKDTLKIKWSEYDNATGYVKWKY